MREQTAAMQAQLSEMKSGGIETGKLITATEKIANSTEDSVAQNKAALDATIEISRLGQRAWVTAKGIEIEKLPPKSGYQEVVWQFRAIGENIGATPTKNARSHVSFQFGPEKMPKDFRFPDLGSNENTPVVIGPKSSIGSSLLNVDANISKAVQARRMHLYFWGWMSYRDIFENTKQHMTKFCRELTEIHGDPVGTTGNTKIIFTHCPYHNCTDEECERHTKNQPAP